MPELMDIALLLVLLVLVVQSIMNAQGITKMSINALLAMGAVIGVAFLWIAQASQLPESPRENFQVTETYQLYENATWQERMHLAARVLAHRPDLPLDSTQQNAPENPNTTQTDSTPSKPQKLGVE